MELPQHKIFCIGLQKTGTTSIGDALEILGCRRLGFVPHISGPLTLRWHEGKMDDFVKLSKQYDVFEDTPWFLVYKEMDRLYPNAQFILTERGDTDKWYKSILKHYGRADDWVGHYLIYGSYRPEDDKDKFVRKYESHNEEVKRYFSSRPGKLLEMCFESGDGWDKLCSYLGMSGIPNVAFPHSNQAPK